MPITHIIETATGLVTLTAVGDVDAAMIKEALEGVVSDPRFVRGADMLWDFTGARGQEATGGGIQDLASFVGSLRERRGSGYRVALVASRDLEYGFARMYQAYAERVPAEIKVFRNIQEARGWLASAAPERDPQP